MALVRTKVTLVDVETPRIVKAQVVGVLHRRTGRFVNVRGGTVRGITELIAGITVTHVRSNCVDTCTWSTISDILGNKALVNVLTGDSVVVKFITFGTDITRK